MTEKTNMYENSSVIEEFLDHQQNERNYKTGEVVANVLVDNFSGSVSFFFSNAVPVTPNATYFFETVSA